MKADMSGMPEIRNSVPAEVQQVWIGLEVARLSDGQHRDLVMVMWTREKAEQWLMAADGSCRPGRRLWAGTVDDLTEYEVEPPVKARVRAKREWDADRLLHEVTRPVTRTGHP